MARGFESKGAAEYADDPADRRKQGRADREEVERSRRREELELTRSRIEHELAATSSEVRRKQLQAALQDITSRLGKS